MRTTDIENALRAAGIHPAKVVGVEEVGDGWECRVFRVARPGVDDVAFRLYTGDPSGGTMRAEVAAYLTLGKVDYPAPRLLEQHSDRELLGAPFVLIDWLEGPLLDSLGRSPDELDMLIDLLVRLHDIIPDRDLANDNSIPVRTNEDLIAGRFTLLDRGGFEGFLPTLQWLSKELPDLRSTALAFVHMDFHPKNVIVTSRGPVVFDWGSFAVADPRADLAWTALLARTYLGEESATHIISAYRDRRPEGIEHLAFFEVSSVWRRFATIVGMLREDPPPPVKEQVLEGIQLLRPAYEYLMETTGTTIAEVDNLYAIPTSDEVK